MSGRIGNTKQPFLNWARRYVSIGLTIALSAFLFILAIQDIRWDEVARTFLQVNPIYLLWGFGITSVAMMARALRWRNLLTAQKPIPVAVIFWATAVGYLGNTLLPARAGEVIRSVTLGNRAGISKSFILATAITERVLDAGILVAAGLYLLPGMGDISERLIPVFWGLGSLSVLLLVLLPFMPGLQRRLMGVVTRLAGPSPRLEKISAFLEQFSLGATAFLHPVRAAIFFLLSGMIWLLDGCGAVILARGMGISLELPQAIIFLAALGLMSALPSTPGYIGIYQITAVTVLPFFGVSRSQALTNILVLQFVNLFTVLLWGGTGLLCLGIKLTHPKDSQAN